MAQSLTILFAPEASEKQQQAVLEKVRNWSGVSNAMHLKPGAKNPLVARMGYVTLGEDADVKDIIARLNSFAEIESAEIPAQRFQVSNR
jgi:hypothetical protein